MKKEISRSAIKSVDIKSSVDKVYAFIAEPLNWPQYAVINMRSVERGENDWYKTVTKFGEGQLKMHLAKELGIFDHTWKDPQASWRVPARVVKNGEGATVMFTLFQPPMMTDEQFDKAMDEMDIEMKQLKNILERNEEGL